MRHVQIIAAAWLTVVLVAVTPAQADDIQPSADSEPARLFAQLDKNGDGSVSADEIDPERRRFFDRLIRIGDKDADARLSRSEFVQALAPDDKPLAKVAPPKPDQAERRGPEPKGKSDAIDGQSPSGPAAKAGTAKDSRPEVAANGLAATGPDQKGAGKKGPPPNGPATKGMKPNPKAAQGPGPKQLTKQFLKKFDSNADGKLARSEAPPRLREKFEKFDRNGDQQLERDELQRAVMALRPAGGAKPGKPAGKSMLGKKAP